MSSTTSGASETQGGRLGGARADFVASLGRKVGDARELLAILEDDISSRPARDELRRRIHALGSGARLLRFDAMAKSLQEALAALDRGTEGAGGSGGAVLREQELAFVAQVLDDLPALAWGEAPPRDPPRPEESADGPSQPPVAILVVGDDKLADALTEHGSDGAIGGRTFECERTEDVQTALELARAYAPDLVLVDADISGTPGLVEALLDDPLTEPVPLVVVGTFEAPETISRFIALGVSKCLTKTVAPLAIRQACDEILDARDGRTMRITLGEPTVDQLADRLVDELRRALVDAVDRPARSCRVPLGEGTEVIGALWGAIARIQEIVTQKTRGAVRFDGDAPEGAIALAPWLHQDLPGADRLGAGRGRGGDVRLRGRRVVVADDDPGVTWFISDLLRTAGCEVFEALDGNAALDLAFRIQPELVVSDILMPGMDGFALSRALRRDVALRDTPVILLSWKEDLLQRVRELGASAAAYMRKESDSRSILARVREVLRPRARIEARLRGDGEVRGRLDGLSPRVLLDLVGSIRKDARVAVRDATSLYEIEIRDGSPRKATLTASDGGYRSGERALGSLLAVGAGRFVVTPSKEPVRGDLSGSLFDLLARPIAGARGALAATTGARTIHIERIVLDPSPLEDYLRATPDPARTVVKKLASGASPRQMLLAGDVSPSLLEDVLADLATRDTVRAVEGADGEDMLASEVAAALAVLRGGQAGVRSPSRPPLARGSAPPPPAHAVQAAAVTAVPRPAAPPPAPTKSPAPAARAAEEDPLDWPDIESDPPPPATVKAPEGAHKKAAAAYVSDDAGSPSSLEDAVMRELSDRSPAPGTTRTPGSDPPPIIEPSALKTRRSSNPPIDDASSDQLPSIPPDAVVPGSASSDEMVAASPMLAARRAGPHSGRLELAESDEDEDEKEDVDDRPTPAALAAAEAHAEGAPTPLSTRAAPAVETFNERTAKTSPPSARTPEPPRSASAPQVTKAPAPAAPAGARRAGTISALAGQASALAGQAAPEPRRRGFWLLLLGFALLAAAAGVVLRATSESEAPAVVATETTPPAPVAPPPAPAAQATASGASAASTAAQPTGDDLPPGAEVPAGYGLVEVTAPAGARIRIDGAVAGAGPTISSVAAPGYHEVRVESGGHESKSVVEVRAGKVARVQAALAP
jgi:CheY-like chemotaxis protein